MIVTKLVLPRKLRVLLLLCAGCASACGAPAAPDASSSMELGNDVPFTVVQVYGHEISLLSSGDGVRTRQLNPQIYVYEAAFHPGESWLIAAADEGLLAMDLDGQVLWLEEGLRRVSQLDWCPGGDRIAFQGRDQNTGFSGVMYLELQSRTVVPVATEARDPSWSPRCDQLLYSEGEEVLRFEVASGRSVSIFEGTAPSWSRDGQTILYRSREGTFRLASSSGQQNERFLDREEILDRPQWSPDSKHLLFVERGNQGLESSLECLEPMQVTIYRVHDERSTFVQQVCKGAPVAYVWVRKGLL